MSMTVPTPVLQETCVFYEYSAMMPSVVCLTNISKSSCTNMKLAFKCEIFTCYNDIMPMVSTMFHTTSVQWFMCPQHSKELLLLHMNPTAEICRHCSEDCTSSVLALLHSSKFLFFTFVTIIDTNMHL